MPLNPASMGTRWILAGSVSGFLAVAAGAFGAHALSSSLSEKALSTFHTASQYQMFHALALVLVGLWSLERGDSVSEIAGWAFAIGTLLFSGSLYALALTGVRWLGAITPLGGLGFLIGWGAFAWSAWKAGGGK